MRRFRFKGTRVITIAVVTAFAVAAGGPASAVTPARVNGAGSSYVALAVQQWVADAQSRGLSVNYLPTSSPDGLTQYAGGLLDFSATEAEYSALFGGSSAGARGFQYVPDVGAATAVMYHVQDRAGRTVNYLHLSMRTIARIFMGYITKWNDPVISAENKGLVLPDKPITVVYRSGQSGTTGTFYDFVAHAAPDLFGQWSAKYHLPTKVRIIQLDGVPTFAPKTIAFGGSDQVAQYIGSGDGMWSIGYDEFGYAKVYNVAAAWVQNAAGKWVLPYAENISAALEAAKLRPDLSQELSGVYASTNPKAYPISMYSYLIVQCAKAGDRPTCNGKYPNPGVTETLARWMKYIQCDGQVNMAQIGYSPMPPNLSQEMANSIARMTGTAPQTLTPANCANPRFHGSLGSGSSSPDDPLEGVPTLTPPTTPGGTSNPGTDPGGGTGTGGSGPGGSGTSGGVGFTIRPCPTTTTTKPKKATTTTPKKTTTTKPKATTTTTTRPGCGKNATAGNAAAGLLGGNKGSVGGGEGAVRAAAPVAYNRPGIPSPASLPAWAFLAVVVVPPIGAGVWRSRRKRAREATS
jgi:phosphate transport system substrate-binding protein